jgi:integrase
MPKIVKELSALETKRITTPGRHAVGNIAGLLLVVKETGAKSWQLRIVIGKKRRSIGLGSYPEVSLADAREKAREAKALIKQGIDPIEQKRARKASLIKSQTEKMTFAEAARLCHEKKQTEFTNAKHTKEWLSTVERLANPFLGNLPVSDIELPHILKVLEPIWTEKTETATRLRQRLEDILAWATVSGYRKGDNPARWKGHLDAVLPAPAKIKKINHYPALPYKQIDTFMQHLRQSEAISARALEFLILTAKRSNEVLGAKWGEIDLENKLWNIPAERMKKKENGDHTVPLSQDVIKLLENLPVFEGSDYLFPSPRSGQLSDMTLSKKVKDLHEADLKNGGKGYIDPKQNRVIVPHGFRSTFRDWCAAETNYPREVAEKALAHTVGNASETAYWRSDLLDKRRPLMEDWGKYCNKVQND